MSVQSEIDRIKNSVSLSYLALDEMGGDIPSDASIENLPNSIRSIDKFALKDNPVFTGSISLGRLPDPEDAEECTIGLNSYAVGEDVVASGLNSHAEGFQTQALGNNSHTEGVLSKSLGNGSHAEGQNTEASGNQSHAEGLATKATTKEAHAEGWKSIASGESSHAEGQNTEASGESSHAEGSGTIASKGRSHSEGYGSIASALNSHAEGYQTRASGNNSHAEGRTSEASGTNSHAEGSATVASGEGAHSEGLGSVASGRASHAEGFYTKAVSPYTHAGGFKSEANIHHAYVGGYKSIATKTIGQVVLGMLNVPSTEMGDFFIIGAGTATDDEQDEIRANCFRINAFGTYGIGAWNSTGADYAEMFEWVDGNLSGEDRVGRFVTLDGEKICLATPDDIYILGIVSGSPSVVGDVHDDQWQGMYLTDIFGRPLWEDVELSEVVDDDGNVVLPARTDRRKKVNPDYNPTIPYIPRSKRSEWAAVGMLGKLVMIDDGSCQVNSWAKPSYDGIATHSESVTKYRVMSRLDETHIRVLIL